MTMVVRHLESRLSLSSVNPSDQLHEFQIVHALITQCRKQASAAADENVRSITTNSHESPLQTPDSNLVRRKGSKDERSSFVTTIRQTFNALAQATNPSLCAKQNVSPHPVSIASTVKNIITQFSQTYHGSLSLASATNSLPPKVTNPSPRQDLSIRKKVTSSKTPKTERNIPQSKSPQNLSEPSTSNGPTLECTTIKTAVIRQSTSNPVATKPKTRSVRARNAHRLTRHESAPIPPPTEGQGTIKKSSASVRRSKSDAVCYTSYIRQSRSKFESNVQTKVLHFENCCKGKGQASMCLECRKHSLEEGLPSPMTRSSSALPKIESAKPKQENCIGALSYHKPSTITQSHNALNEVCGATPSSVPEITQKKIPPPTTAKPKAVMCPGGTLFLSTHPDNVTVPCAKSVHNDPPAIDVENDAPCATKDVAIDTPLCSQMKRKHSGSDDDPMQHKREIKENDVVNTSALKLEASSNDTGTSLTPQEASPLLSLPKQEADNLGNSDLESKGAVGGPVACESQNLYSILLNFEKAGEQSSESAITNSLENFNEENEDSDSSDVIDSASSSSGEACVSPRQDYLSRCARRSTSLRRAPSTRYQKMRRKLKKLITRSRSCSEVIQPVVIQTPSEIEREFLELIRIPTPVFMLSKDSFSAKRLQLAMHFDSKRTDLMSRLPDPVLVKILSYMDTRSLAMLKCVCQDFKFVIDSYDIRGTDSLWVKDRRYLDDPCRFCRKRFTAGDVSMCRYHAKSYHRDLPYGRSYWMCCFQIERSAPGCRTGIHNNHWGPLSPPTNS